MFLWFGRKKEIDEMKEETKKSFDSVKKDITSVSGWIKHLDSEKNLQKKEIEEIKGVLSSIRNDVDGLKNVLSVMNELKPNRLFKTPKQVFNKQTAVYTVQTGVQTGVQTLKLSQFSVTERAILWVLLNTDMRLSYDDIAAMLGKERSTIRGQINTIKQKSEGLIEEEIEKNGKKRVFIPEEMKEKMLKKTKVRVKSSRKDEK
jgi:biotin operon repressor